MRAAQQASNPLRTSYMTTPWGWIVGSCHRKSRGEKQRAESGDEKKPSPQASSLSVSPWSSSRNTRALLCSHLPPVALRSSPAPSPARDSLNTQLSLEHDAAWLPRPSYTNLRAIMSRFLRSLLSVALQQASTCIRLFFRTDTNDLAGGVRCGKGAMVISRTRFVLREGPAGWGGLPTTAAELPTPPRPLEPRGPTGICSCSCTAAAPSPLCRSLFFEL